MADWLTFDASALLRSILLATVTIVVFLIKRSVKRVENVYDTVTKMDKKLAVIEEQIRQHDALDENRFDDVKRDIRDIREHQ